MKRVFVDTNVFIRYLVNDVPAQVDRVENLFDSAEKRDIILVTGPPVFFELTWTLKSFYKLSKKRIYECLKALIGLPGLEVIDIDIIEEALEIFNETSTDFSDAYLAVLAEKHGVDSIATFNVKHFKNLSTPTYPFK